mgnify:CR=1 FL=1
MNVKPPAPPTASEHFTESHNIKITQFRVEIAEIANDFKRAHLEHERCIQSIRNAEYNSIDTEALKSLPDERATKIQYLCRAMSWAQDWAEYFNSTLKPYLTEARTKLKADRNAFVAKETEALEQQGYVKNRIPYMVQTNAVVLATDGTIKEVTQLLNNRGIQHPEGGASYDAMKQALVSLAPRSFTDLRV